MGDVDGVSGEVAEVEGVEVESCGWLVGGFGCFVRFVRLVFCFWVMGWDGMAWDGWFGFCLPSTMRVATR